MANTLTPASICDFTLGKLSYMTDHPQILTTVFMRLNNNVANCRRLYGHVLTFKIVDHQGTLLVKKGILCTIDLFSRLESAPFGQQGNRKHNVN